MVSLPQGTRGGLEGGGLSVDLLGVALLLLEGRVEVVLLHGLKVLGYDGVRGLDAVGPGLGQPVGAGVLQVLVLLGKWAPSVDSSGVIFSAPSDWYKEIGLDLFVEGPSYWGSF